MKKILHILPLGLRYSTRNQLKEILIFFKHRNGLVKARRFRKSSDLKLHLGCGKNIKKGWINIDLNNRADLQLDLRENLPFGNDSCSMIYSEHFLEHIDYPEQVTTLLKECHRILKPGGVFSVSVPDIDLVLRSYVDGGTAEYYAAQKKYNPPWCVTQVEHINYIFRQMNEHLFCYDFETLKNLLEKCKFVEVKRRNINTELDDKKFEVGSLYVNALKPTVTNQDNLKKQG